MRGRPIEKNSLTQRAKRLGIWPSTLRMRENKEAREIHNKINLGYYYTHKEQCLENMRKWREANTLANKLN